MSAGGSGCGKVSECIGGVVHEGIHGVVGSMVALGLCGSLGESPIVMCFGEVGFEVGPCFCSFCLATPFPAAFREHSRVKDE